MSPITQGLFQLILTCQLAHSWLFFSPVSRAQTVADCKNMKDSNSPFYPNYCDRLLALSGAGLPTDFNSSLSAQAMQMTVNGWGWSEWSEWLDNSCPDVCEKKCRRRIRVCHGPFLLVCGDGRADDFDKCEAINNPGNDNGSEAITSLPEYYDYEEDSSATNSGVAALRRRKSTSRKRTKKKKITH